MKLKSFFQVFKFLYGKRLFKLYSIALLFTLTIYSSLGLMSAEASDIIETEFDFDFEIPGNDEIGEIAPFSEWDSILLGEWEIFAEINKPNSIVVFKGEVEYLKDGKNIYFIKKVQYAKFYDSEINKVRKANEYLETITRGSIVGDLEFYIDEDDDGFEIKEIPDICNQEIDFKSKKFSLCKNDVFFSKELVFASLTYDEKNEKALKVLTLTKDKIIAVDEKNYLTPQKRSYYILLKKDNSKASN